jgi:hypothetical protein
VVAVCVLTPLPTIPAEAGSTERNKEPTREKKSAFFMFYSKDESEGAMSSPSLGL